MAQAFDLVSNIHFDWIYTREPMVRNSGINIRRVKEDNKVLGYIIVVDHNPECDLLSFEILKTTINFYIQECRKFENYLQLRIPKDENFESVNKMMEKDINAAFSIEDVKYVTDAVIVYKLVT